MALKGSVEYLEKYFQEEMKKFEKKLDGNAQNSGSEKMDGMQHESSLVNTRTEFASFKLLIMSMLDEIKMKLNEMDEQIEEQENYSRRHCLLIHGVEEDTKENTDDIVLKLCKEHLKVTLNLEQIERSHRLGKPRGNNSRPIIVRFCSYRTRQSVFSNKKQLKGKKIVITESLSRKRRELFRATKDVFEKACWTRDGVVFVKVGAAVRVIRNQNELKEAQNERRGEERRGVNVRPRQGRQ